MTVPEYIKINQCNNASEIIHCDYFVHDDCLKTCAYARDIRGTKEKKELANKTQNTIRY